ncbi:MAG: hypothetical protein AAF432_00500 [Planctomycetota bacterium]
MMTFESRMESQVAIIVPTDLVSAALHKLAEAKLGVLVTKYDVSPDTGRMYILVDTSDEDRVRKAMGEG